jgi:hypothetical protein
MGPFGWSLGHWGHALEGDCGDLVSSLFFFLFLFLGHEVGGFVLPHIPTVMCCLSTGAKADQSWIETSKTVDHTTFFSL